jgi:long-chain acyl-CoA synthetase
MAVEPRTLKTLLDGAGTWTPEPACDAVRLAEAAARGDGAPAGAELWRRYLDLTGRTEYLQVLPNREWRYRWAETAFAAIRLSNYTLGDLLRDRVRRHPERILFRWSDPGAPRWTYGAVERRLRNLAGLFLSSAAAGEPRVAIFSDNSVESACCDLACLVHGIFVTPLSVHFDATVLSWVFDRLAITVAVTDTDERQEVLERIRATVRTPFQIFRTRPSAGTSMAATLDGACTKLDLTRAEQLLNARGTPGLDAAATAMFTSGSTGLPKGVLFSLFNIVSKRFARAAALPAVGNKEVLLCYLPLFHTFGRYLEMLGTIFWGGTYVFAGNPSVETLISQMQQIRPTGLISIPLRWSQIRDTALEATKEGSGNQESALRSLVGDRLRWGLSAAGFLDPKVFRFFQRHGVDLCSGFGMTEATGGITMTPPGEYVDNSVGIPLPGAHVRFGESGELQVAGPYIAHYLAEESSGAELPATDPDSGYWLKTGDLFQLHDNGHLEIVDRIKDIYKNSRGQTIAPRRVEQKFDDVPGVKRAFLVGDHRDYNVLLLVPNRQDIVLQAPADQAQTYFRHLVRAANEGLAPFERVVNFAVLDRDFAVERDELTPKGSYKRRIIEEHFRPVIESLYESSYTLLQAGALRVRIPRWFFRDLGALENDLVAGEREIRNTETGLSLRLEPVPGSRTVQLGDLEYEIAGDVVDLGLFSRQPRLWAGNPALFAFCPCKDGWDVPLAGVSAHVRLPWDRTPLFRSDPAALVRPGMDQRLRDVQARCSDALHGSGAVALTAVRQLGEMLQTAGIRYAAVIRRRLEALARHPEEPVRCLAYRILLSDEPGQEYSESFPAFLESGLSFLTAESIREIAESDLRESHLDALRQRLFRYRKELSWPAEPVMRDQFRRIFALLAAFAETHHGYFAPVRAELAAWALHRPDPDLAGAARDELEQACTRYRQALPPREKEFGTNNVLFEDGTAPAHEAALGRILGDSTFLAESVRLGFDEAGFSTDAVTPSGVWASHVSSQHQLDLFRVSINLRDGKHFDLLIATGDDLQDRRAHDTALLMMALSSLPYAPPAVPQFGTYRPDLRALSVAYINDLTVWERVRQFSATQDPCGIAAGSHEWQRLFTRGMAAFFRLWRLSGGRLVPGIGPANVVVPNADFRENSLVLSLAGSHPYAGPLAMVRAMLRNFYRQTAAHYPKSWNHLRTRWIVDAVLEGMGQHDGEQFFRDLKLELAGTSLNPDERELAAVLEAFLQGKRQYLPLAAMCAIDRFADWQRINPNATRAAREEQTEQVFRMYRLDRYPNLVRYHLYRHTYFGQSDEKVVTAFNHLLAETSGSNQRTAAELERLSELQAALSHPADRDVFSRMVLPQAPPDHPVQIAAMGEGSGKQLVLRTRIADSHGVQYEVREPVGASEVGYMFRLLFEEGPPGHISEQDRFLVAMDDQERIVGAVRFKADDESVVSIEGIAVSNALKGRRIGSTLLDDFCARIAGAGTRVVKTGYILRRFFLANGFTADARWGGLVRFLSNSSN